MHHASWAPMSYPRTTPPFAWSQLTDRCASTSFAPSSSNPVIAVTQGVLKGGLDGTDEWTVKCRDTGIWQVWFNPEGPPDVVHCGDKKCT